MLTSRRTCSRRVATTRLLALIAAGLAACSSGEKPVSNAEPGDDDGRSTIPDEPGDGDDEKPDQRRTIRIERVGGQTGMEGSCLLPEVAALPFDASDLSALLGGAHVTSLAERQLYPTTAIDDEPGRAVTIEIAEKGEPRIELRCGGVMDQDIELTLRFEEPALDVIVETYVRAFSKEFAVLEAKVDREVGRLLGWPGAASGQAPLVLMLRIEPSGVTGTFDTGATYGCGLAVLPAGARCAEWAQLELDPAVEVDGYVPGDVTDAIETFAAVPITWNDGSTTTLTLSVERTPTWACTHQWFETPCPYQLDIPLTVRVVSADGLLDLVLPARAEVEVVGLTAVESNVCGTAEHEGWTGELNLQIAAIVPESQLPAEAEMVRAALPEGSALSVVMRARAEGESMDELSLSLGALPIGDDAPELSGVIDATGEGPKLACYPAAQVIASATLAASE